MAKQTKTQRKDALRLDAAAVEKDYLAKNISRKERESRLTEIYTTITEIEEE